MTEEKNYYSIQRKFWKIFAPFYDIAVWPASKLRDTVVTYVNAPRGAKILDVSCVSLALHEMPLTVREKVLQEMVRVTKPKGMVVTIDFDLPGNKVGRFLIYNFLRLFEGEHYVKYVKSDLKKSIEKAGIVITGEIPVLLGGARIIKGTTPA